jgi:hypothetical protein
MKKALISPMEPRESGYRVAEVIDQEFPVSLPLYWVDCADDIVADEYWYNPENNEFVLFPVPDPVAPDANQPISVGAQTL